MAFLCAFILLQQCNKQTKYQTNDKGFFFTESDKDYMAFKNELYIECLLSVNVLNAAKTHSHRW